MKSIFPLVALVASLFIAACSSTPALTAPSASLSPNPSGPTTRVTAAPESPAPPSYVRWAVDNSGDAARPYFLELFVDGMATGFRVIDASGQLVLRLPIAGSGIFGPETCIVRARAEGKQVNATWVLIDVVGREHFEHDGMTYRVEVDTIGGRTVTLPLTDSGCRPL